MGTLGWEVKDAQFTKLSGLTTKQGEKILLRAESAAQKLKLRAAFIPHPGHIEVDCELEDTSGSDRAVVVSFRLPFDAIGWTWFTDIHERETIEQTRAYHFGYKTAKFPQRAKFNFILYRHDPRWGMRSAAQRYYRFYPQSFKKRTTYEGYLNYAGLERYDPATHQLGSAGRELKDASDFGEGFNFIGHMHGWYLIFHVYKHPAISDVIARVERGNWDCDNPARVDRFMRTMGYQKIWRFSYTPKGGDEEVRHFFRRDLAYAIFPFRLSASNRHLYRKYVPATEKLSAAGWEPVPYARGSDESVVIERFGTFADRDLHFTLRNHGKRPKKTRVTLDSKALGISAASLKPLSAVDLLSNQTLPLRDGAFTVTVDGDGSLALRVATAEGHAQYALRQADEGLRRIERMFATELTKANHAMIAAARQRLEQSRGGSSGALLAAAE